MTTPDYFLPEQFCNSGVQSIDYVIPPVTSADPAAASLETGAPPLQQVRPSLGGAVFPRQQYNGALRLLSNILTYLNKGGEFTFDPKNTAGYALDAVLYDYASKRYVVSLKDNNTANFVTNPTLINNVDWAFLTITPAMLNSYALLSGAAFSGEISVQGVPTKGAGIIASGSNANGKWIKYANGRIVQTGTLVMVGSINAGLPVTLPISFTTSFDYVNGSTDVNNGQPEANNTFPSRTLSTFNFANYNGVTVNLNWIAEGY